MSLARLFLSGLLVAGGLILGAFTLHGYFDPQWAQKQMQAAAAGKSREQPKSINTFKGRSRFVSSRQAHPESDARPQNTSAAAPVASPVVKAAATRPATKAQARKKAAEKAKARTEEPRQAAFQWPLWKLFNN